MPEPVRPHRTLVLQFSIRLLVIIFAVFGQAGTASADEDLASLLLGMEAAYAKVTDYTARFTRQEWLNGGLQPREEMLLKFQRPARMYLRWTLGPPKGREILFVQGRDDDKILVHEPGLLAGLFTSVMAADSPRVLKESRHPVTDIGLGYLIELLVSNMKRALERSELTLVDSGITFQSGHRIRRLEGIMPRDPRQNYYCYRAVVSIDLEWGLPVAVTIFDWDNRMIEEYTYRDLRLNPGLREIDFDPANPEYSFPRWRLQL